MNLQELRTQRDQHAAEFERLDDEINTLETNERRATLTSLVGRCFKRIDGEQTAYVHVQEVSSVHYIAARTVEIVRRSENVLRVYAARHSDVPLSSFPVSDSSKYHEISRELFDHMWVKAFAIVGEPKS